MYLHPQSVLINDASFRCSICDVDPVLSIPAGGDAAATDLQRSSDSEQSVGDVSSGRTSPVAMPEFVTYYPPSGPVFLEPSLSGDEAVREASEISSEEASLAYSSSDSVCSCDFTLEELREELEELAPQLEGGSTTSESGEASEAEDAIADSPAELSDGIRHDARLEELVNRYKESSAAVEQKLWQRVRVEEEQWLLQSATVRFYQPTGNMSSEFDIAEASLADLRCTLLETNEKIAENCALVEDLSRKRKKLEQAQLPEKTRQEEAGSAAAGGAPEPLCKHCHRRCFVRFSCCSDYFACYRCHNDRGGCEEVQAWDATHLKCADCCVEQEINEDSHQCSACSNKLSEYFCGKCKHFTKADQAPFHCDKCGICRLYKDETLHCDLCNICVVKKSGVEHKCRPDSGHETCGVCLKDSFSGCQILPCTHKVHKSCVASLMQRGIITCPVCRDPFFTKNSQRPDRPERRFSNGGDDGYSLNLIADSNTNQNLA